MRSSCLLSGAVVLGSLALGVTAAFADEPGRPPSPPPSAAPNVVPTPAAPLQWRSIGPAVSGGRVATVAGTDRDPALFYVGAAGGGVWKSVNGGIDWRPVFDHAGSQSIGAIAISPADVNDVWVGTGEAWPRNDVLPGDGIYHTTDGGETWTNAGLRATSQIARVLIDPRDTKRILVAALGDPFRDTPDRGVFLSTDGGASWQKTLYAGPSVGASDIARDPQHPDVLYAGLWRFRRSAWRLTSGGADDGIYKSTDGGATWTKLTAAGLPAGVTGRIGLAIAPSDPKRIYALIESSEGLLWRSDDGGVSWAKTSSNTLIDERPFYYTRITVDPHDENHLFSDSVLLAESTHGGTTWHVSGKRLHGDHHDMWIAADGRTILEGNDGGVGISRDGGASWQWRNTLPLAQFYHVGLDNEQPYHICGGLQDNGSWCAPVRTGDERGILAQDWLKIGGGDGTWAVPDPSDSQTIYSAFGGGDNGGELIRFDRRSMNQNDVSIYLRDQNVVAPSRLRYRFSWETPLAADPFTPHRIYAAGNVVFRTDDGGRHWTPLSPDLTRNLKARQILSGGPLTLDVTGAETFDTILAIAPSPVARGTLWIGTDDGVVQVTRDGGRHWANVSLPGADADGRVPIVEASHRFAATAYAVVDRHYVGDRAPYVFATDDLGKHWRAIVNGLPSADVHSVREDPVNPSVLYAGTGKGVWWSDNRGASWQPFPAAGLPPTEVRDLAVAPGGDLVAATHGRGMFVFDDLGPLREHVAQSSVRFFTPREALPLQRFTPTAIERAAGQDAAPVTFTFWQSETSKAAAAIDILDARGRVVRRIAGTHEDDDGNDVAAVTNLRGYNRVAWDLSADPPVPWRRVAPWNRGPDGGVTVPHGTYTVRLRRDGVTYDRPLRVLPDRRVTSPQDEAHGYAFATTMLGELGALDDALNGLDNVRLQLADHVASIRDAALAQRARDAIAAAQRLEGAISSQPVNDQDDDFLEDLLRERVLTFVGNLAPGTPTHAMYEEGAVLQRAGSVALARYRAFVARVVRPLNDALGSAGVATIDLGALPPKTKRDPNADEHARRESDSEH